MAPALNFTPKPLPELWEQVSGDLSGEFRDMSHHLLPDTCQHHFKAQQGKEYSLQPKQRNTDSPQQHQHSKVKGVSNNNLHF